MSQRSHGEPIAAGQDGHRPSAHDLYRHMRDQDVPEAELERSTGEGRSIQDLYGHQLMTGLIAPI